MIIHDVVPGSAEWLALRAKYKTASEAPAMMGQSKLQTRAALLDMKKTGEAKEVSWFTQQIFDKGHVVEDKSRVIVEGMLGEELFQIVGSRGQYLASMDGANLIGDTLFEHKQWNEELAEAVRAKELDAQYWIQLEQQLYVTGAERVIFVCSNGTKEKMVWMEYRAVPGRWESIASGWDLFTADLSTHVVTEDKPKVRSTCLRMQPLMRDVIGTPSGHILPSCPGKLYVGGLFVCDTEMTHGYDVNPAYLGLERDRQTVNGFSLKYLTRDMWLATQRWDDIISMLEAEAADVSLIEHSTVPAELAEQAAVRFEATHGAALPVTSQAQANKYRDRGLTTAYTPRALGYVVAQSPRIAARLAGPDPVLSPKQTLENWLHENKRYLARLPKVAFKKLITQAEAWSAERGSNRTFF